jgi:hypothetical protein
VFTKKLKDKVLMIGYNKKEQSVYTAFMTLDQYYDGEHPWDSSEKVKSLAIKTVRGYIFDETGKLYQEFETTFKTRNGIFESGWQRDETGKIMRS